MKINKSKLIKVEMKINKSRDENMILKSKKLIFLLILFSIFSSILIINSDAYERPEYDNALVAPWHTGGYCVPCHYSLMDIKKARDISTGCKCHDFQKKGAESKYIVEMTKIVGIHKDIICVRCHIGIKSEDEITAQEFHRIMPIDCKNCHNQSEGTYVIPEKKCSACHMNGDPHLVHGNKIEKICTACHGTEFAGKYVGKKLNVSAEGISVQSEIIREYPTIVKYIDNIIKMVLGR